MFASVEMVMDIGERISGDLLFIASSLYPGFNHLAYPAQFHLPSFRIGRFYHHGQSRVALPFLI